MAVPSFAGMFNATLEALRNLGGSASISELEDEVASILGLTEDDVTAQVGSRRTLAYRLAWARSYLKYYGLLDNSTRGVWSLTARGTETPTVDPDEVKRVARAKSQAQKKEAQPEDIEEEEAAGVPGEGAWRDDLLEILQRLEPSQFERLCQRILRESGFSQVEVTGRSGDGGIDGTGIIELGGLLGFPVLFQSKRYQGSVGAGVVRDFRGAMVGRADRGLILTTGLFTREARREASRDGAPPIDLVDRDRLLDKLKDLNLGVIVEVVESVSIDPDWFDSI